MSIKGAVNVLSKQEMYMLYALGQSNRFFNKMFLDKPLQVTISKPLFLDLMISSKAVKKKERALYKNLESLEKKRFIKYKNNELGFTKKGLRSFQAMDKEINEFFDLVTHLCSPKTISLHKKLQTKLKN
jgi:predicted methyltransferase